MERRDLETVRYEKGGPVARVILNRPDKANAQNSAMVWDVENCMKDAEADYDVKVVLLKATGAGSGLAKGEHRARIRAVAPAGGGAAGGGRGTPRRSPGSARWRGQLTRPATRRLAGRECGLHEARSDGRLLRCHRGFPD